MPLSLRGRPEEADALAVIHAAVDAGMTLIDTADVYCVNNQDLGHNERLIAKALAARADRASLTVATKGGLRRPRGAWTSEASPAALKRACEASLSALGVERIDLYQLHAPDENVPFADSVGALAELRDAGKIRDVGLSNVSVAELEEAMAIVPIVSVQNRFNLLDPSPLEDGVLAWCAAHDVAFLAYSPVGGSSDRAALHRNKSLRAVASRLGLSTYQIAILWTLQRAPVVIPIPGASKIPNAQSSAAAMGHHLDAATIAELDAAFGVPSSESLTPA